MFQCKDLLTLPSLAKARIISGKRGLENGVRWIYKPESMDFTKWIKGGELLIVSTSIIHSDNFDLLKLIKKSVNMNLAGAILLTGNDYIKTVSKEVIHYSDNCKFPIFVISGEIPLIDIFEEIGHAIAYYDNTDYSNDDAIYSIVFGNKVNVDAIRLKSEINGYDLTMSQGVFFINICKSKDTVEYNREEICQVIRNCFLEYGIDTMLSCFGNNFIGIFQKVDKTNKKLSMIYENIKYHIYKKYPKSKVYLGIGRTYDGLEYLKESFKEASRCIIFAERMNKKSSILYFDDMGFFQLLFEIGKTKLVEDYINNTIGSIIKYDDKNNTELLQTLKVYIENNCSILHTSEQLHTHRNTIKYRIQRVEEITDKSIEDFMTRLEFMNAILCMEINKII